MRTGLNVRKGRGFRVGDVVRVISEIEPFKGSIGTEKSVEREWWRIAPS